VSNSVGIPVIASGGAGNAQHFADVFAEASADAALAASIFHYKEVSVQEVKNTLRGKGVNVR
jgi:cyclase